jgi:hypothetical protein
MATYQIGGKQVSVVEKAKHKLKHLNEASEMLDDISAQFCWTCDSCEYSSIYELIDQVLTVLEESKDHMDEMIQEIEDKLEEYEQEVEASKQENERELDKNITHLLD